LKSETAGYQMGDYEFIQTPHGGLYMQTADDTTPVWELRSTNDYASSSNTHTSFGDHATGTANADAESKAERMGYHMGDYAFVQTPEGGLYLETNDDIPASETLIDLSEKNPIVAQ